MRHVGGWAIAGALACPRLAGVADKVRMSELPSAVRSTLQREAKGRASTPAEGRSVAFPGWSQ